CRRTSRRSCRRTARTCSASPNCSASRRQSNALLATERFEDRALLAWLCAVVAVLSLLPLARLVVEGFAPGGTLSTSALTRVLASSTTWLATGHSLVTAFGGTV